MNCRSFETTITELARGQMLEARLKEGLLAHMKDCRRCAARLADEQALTAGLRSVAAKAALTEAPVHMEEVLLKTFRQRAASSFVPSNPPVRVKAQRWRLWALATAAAVLIASTLAVSRLMLSSSNPAQREAQAVRSALPPPSTEIKEEAKPNVELTDRASVAGDPKPTLAVDPLKRTVHRKYHQTFNPRSVAGRSQPAYEEVASANGEIATDFMPLTYAGGLSQTDGGQVVRVEMPRSALQTFGLPVNAERASERVKADVLLGNDGVARAIRFVK